MPELDLYTLHDLAYAPGVAKVQYSDRYVTGQGQTCRIEATRDDGTVRVAIPKVWGWAKKTMGRKAARLWLRQPEYGQDWQGPSEGAVLVAELLDLVGPGFGSSTAGCLPAL
jgi:hypothetical protein